MKDKTSNLFKRNSFLLPSLILFGLFFTAYVIIPLYLLHSNDSFVQGLTVARMSWIESNKDQLLYVYTDVFPRAEKCTLNHQDCEQELRNMIDANLNDTLSFEYGGTRVGRLPIFFIRLKDPNTIEKLYQSGEFKEEIIDTKEEKMVVEMLQGTRDPFAYPQYNCCGGDDIISEIPFFKRFLPPRVYLKDFPTEIEQIYLLREEENNILGGLVYLYGD